MVSSAVARSEESIDEREVCTTSEAARLLEVSNTTVQIMVERGDLRAWRTRGGHRRISLESLHALKSQRTVGARAGGDSPLLTVLVVEDDQDLKAVYRARFDEWNLPVRVLEASDGVEALLMLERNRPDILLTDLRMSPMDGFELLRRVREYPEFNSTTIVVVTALSEAEIGARGGVPKGVVVYPKPVPFEKLQGFLEASAMRKQLARA